MGLLTEEKSEEARVFADKASACIKGENFKGALANLESAKKIYQKASAFGLFFIDDYDYVEYLGDLYRKIKKYPEAIAMYELAYGNTFLWTDKLGDIYYEELGDFKKALDIYRKDYLEKENPRAAFQLGRMSLKGHGVKTDAVDALKWFNIALIYCGKRYDQGDPDNFINKTRDKLKSEMTFEQIEKADKLTEIELKKKSV